MAGIQPAKPPWFQFSMLRLMVAVTLLAILLGIATSFGGIVELVFVSLVWCIVPAPLLICAIFGSGDIQAFSIGALVPWTSLLLKHEWSVGSQFAGVIWLLVMGTVCGALSVATRRWLDRVQP
jgi:hypothetical protein